MCAETNLTISNGLFEPFQHRDVLSQGTERQNSFIFFKKFIIFQNVHFCAFLLLYQSLCISVANLLMTPFWEHLVWSLTMPSYCWSIVTCHLGRMMSPFELYCLTHEISCEFCKLYKKVLNKWREPGEKLCVLCPPPTFQKCAYLFNSRL